VTSIAKLSSLLSETDSSEDGNWALDPADPVAPAGVEDLNLAAILHALSDPVRLRIVCQLADGGERTCGSLDLPVAKSTCSHHFRVLREAGVVAQRLDGKCRFNRLRMDELEQRFPGLLDAVLRAQAPSDLQHA
jgi:DNA-binding transcriptional ArsR family regulator